MASFRVNAAILIAMLVIPVLFVMKYLFSYDVKAVGARAKRKAKLAEKRAARAKKSKEKAKQSSNDVALKYAVLAKNQHVDEADESDSSTDSESSDEEIPSSNSPSPTKLLRFLTSRVFTE